MLYAGAAGWLIVLWYGSRWDSPAALYVAGFVCALLAAVLARDGPRVRLAAVGVLALAAGAWRMDLDQSGSLAEVVGTGEVWVKGTVLEERSRHTYLIRASEPAEGDVLLRAGRGTKLWYGDLVGITGVPVADGNLEPYERELARSTGSELVFRYPRVALIDSGRRGPIGATLWAARARVSLILERHLPQRMAPLTEGLLLGGSLRVEPEIKASFRRSGISHILAASGYNVTVVAGLILVLLRPLLGARWAVGRAAAAVLVYAGMAGFSPSVTRAAIMGVVGLGAIWLGRPSYPARALAVAAVLLTLWQPASIFDVGAQLSFAAAAGLIVLYPLVLRLLAGLWRPLAEAVGVSLTAQAATLPLALHYFGGLSVWSVAANIIIAPLVPAAMLLSALTILAGLIAYPAGTAVGYVAGRMIESMVGVAELVSQLPWSEIQMERIGAVPVLLYYVRGGRRDRLPASRCGGPVEDSCLVLLVFSGPQHEQEHSGECHERNGERPCDRQYLICLHLDAPLQPRGTGCQPAAPGRR